MNEQLEHLKKNYENIEIPVELDVIVEKALKQKKKRPMMRRLIVTGAAAVLFITGINTSSTFANSLSEVPLVGSIVKVLTFREFKVDEGTIEANIKVPAIQNLDNKVLETSLNNKYVEESKKLYHDFKTEMEHLKQNGGGHLGLDSGYIVKTDNAQILSVGRYVVNTVGSSSTTFQYDTVDKKNQLLITLPSLFKDDSYIDSISVNIKDQMRQQMLADSNKIYWIDGTENDPLPTSFESIDRDQTFYINNQGKLVIVFNKYDVAPGYMGVVEFIIPTEVIADRLVSHEYIK